MGLKFERFNTTPGVSPYDQIKWKQVDAVITDPAGNIKYEQKNITVPESWSKQATQVVSEKYFRVIKGKKETSAKDMFERVVTQIVLNGISQGMFETAADAETYAEELRFILVNQMFAFNSPVWFNVGVLDDPQSSACFIQEVQDTMESITDTLKREMMLFKGGSGTGSNLSQLRSSYEKLSGGGMASGPVSFMEVFDSGAGVTKSGGTTRRAAKMVVLNADHPDILMQKNGRPGFIRVKSNAEQLAHDLYDTGKYGAEFNAPNNVYEKVGFQNANNSVRVTDEFMKAVKEDGYWDTKAVMGGQTIERMKARDLWNEIIQAAHFCGDPGLQFDTTTNKWHTCKKSGKINASNPCSEYLFLDDTACNLGSFNLMKFFDPEKGVFFIEQFAYSVRVCITAMEILVGFSSYPSPAITQNSKDFRPLGIGYANLGALLMSWGLAYDSDEGRAVAAAITAIMSGEAYAQSGRMADAVKPFAKFDLNRESFCEVMDMHNAAAHAIPNNCPQVYDLTYAAKTAWDMAVSFKGIGYRNAQIAVIAPTGTISFLMDCDTTGCEPSISTVSFKKLVGGGYLKMVNKIVPVAMKRLGYTAEEIARVEKNVELYDGLTSPKEGDSTIKPEHYKVFQTALDKGVFEVSVDGHLKMMAAIQPFLSGAISKTVNMAHISTLGDVERAYMMSWELGLKCVAIFRDGCKLSQPVSTTKTDTTKKEMVESYTGMKWGERKRMPEERQSITHTMEVGQQKAYVTVGKYDDGSPGEIFMEISKSGSTLDGITNMAMTFASIALQHGAPLSTLINKMKHTKFEPNGFTSNRDKDLRIVSSIGDYLAKWLEKKFYSTEKPDEPVILTPAINKMPMPDLGENSTGIPCGKCGNMLQQAGSCKACPQCGETTGCG